MASIPQQGKKNTALPEEMQDSPKLVKLGDRLVTEHEMEIDLLAVSLAITRAEIMEIDKGIAAKERHLTTLEEALEKENNIYEEFLERIEKKCADARTLFEKNRKSKENTIAATEKLTNEIELMKSEIAKNEGILSEYTRFKDILYRLLCSEGLEGQEADPRLDKDNSKYEEKLELYLSNPRQLLDHLIAIKEKTLFLFENSAKVDEPVDELQQTIEATKKTMTEDEKNLTLRVNEKKCRLDEVKKMAAQLEKNIKLHHSLKTVDQDVLLKALDVKITEVRDCCRDASFIDMSSTLEKLTTVEDHISHLYEQVENIPEQVFKRLKQIKDNERKNRMREEKLRQEEEKRKERLKKCTRRSLGETKKPSGRQLMPRCTPIERKIQVNTEENVPVEDNTDIYQFTNEAVVGANMNCFFKEGKKQKEARCKNEQAAQKLSKQAKEGCMIGRTCHKKLQFSHEQTSKVNLKPTRLPPISNKDKLKSKDNLAYRKAAAGHRCPPAGMDGSNHCALTSTKQYLERNKLQPLCKEGGKFNLKPTQLPPISNPIGSNPTENMSKVTGDSLPKYEKTRSTKLNLEQNKPQVSNRKNSKVNLKPTKLPPIYPNEVMDSWTGPVKLDCPIALLLELHIKRTEEEQLKAEKKEREKVLERLQQRIDGLCNRLKEVKELITSYDMFLKDKDADRVVEKAVSERKEGLLKEAEYKRLEEDYNELLEMNRQLQCQVQRQAKYQNFMEQLVKMTTWENVEEFMCHSETLLHVSDQLYQTTCKTQDHVCKLRKELRTLEDQHHLLLMHMNNQISQLQTELAEACSESMKWQREWTHITKTAATKTLSLGKIKMATLNLYEMINVKAEEEEGVAMTDTEQQLKMIKMFIKDYNDIVKQYQSLQ